MSDGVFICPQLVCVFFKPQLDLSLPEVFLHSPSLVPRTYTAKTPVRPLIYLLAHMPTGLYIHEGRGIGSVVFVLLPPTSPQELVSARRWMAVLTPNAISFMMLRIQLSDLWI